MEKARPAKNVLAARAVLPERSPNNAEAVQHIMITAIPARMRLRRALGLSTW